MQDKEPEIQKIAEETTRDVEQGLTGVAPPESHGSHNEHLRRTWGNRIFDLAVWPTIAFGAVYGLSTWAVKSAKDTGSKMSKVYESLAESLTKVMPGAKEAAKNLQKSSKAGQNMSLILISFAVGTALMAPIKLLEDRRSKISHWIDKKLGTEPSDPSHYRKEPKQSWRSVLGGRLVTFLSVLGIGTAIGGERTERITQKAANFAKRHWKGFKPEATPEALEKVGKWTEANAFEMFYTSLCAGMVYVLSRTFARRINNHDDKIAAAHHHPAAEAQPADDSSALKEATSWRAKTATREAPPKLDGFINTVDHSRAAADQHPALG